MILAIGAFVFKIYLMSRGLETNDNYFKGGVIHKRLRTIGMKCFDKNLLTN